MEKNEEIKDITSFDYKDLYIRLYADVENMRKRYQKENKISKSYFIKIIGIIFDNHY